MTQTASQTIAQYYSEAEAPGPSGAFGHEGGETGFPHSGTLSLTEWAEWEALFKAERAIREAHEVESCECCGPFLSEEGEALISEARKALLPTWYQRRKAGLRGGGFWY